MSLRTHSIIETTFNEVSEKFEEGETLCANFTFIEGGDEFFVQVIPGVINVGWPSDEEPLAQIRALNLPEIPGYGLIHFEPGSHATFSFETVEDRLLAQFVDLLMIRLYNMEEDYQIEAETFSYQDETIPETIQITPDDFLQTGIFDGESQYLAGTVATRTPNSETSAQDVLTWYAVLHTFDEDGTHLESYIKHAGTTADCDPEVTDNAARLLDKMLESLSQRVETFIEIGLFYVEHEGQEFGLVDSSTEEEVAGEMLVQATLIPNEFTFREPWDGAYEG